MEVYIKIDNKQPNKHCLSRICLDTINRINLTKQTI